MIKNPFFKNKGPITLKIIFNSCDLKATKKESKTKVFDVKSLDQCTDKDISFYINSPGGSVTAGLAIYDTIQYIKPDISTVCVGQAASMGSLLLAAGTIGKRYALPNARIMMHQPSGGVQGQATD